MGSLQFVFPHRDGLAQLAVRCAYLVGNDGAPWETRAAWADGRLTMTRAARESGRLIVPWNVPGFGLIALSTATLLPRERPYHLPLELCRGTLNRILFQCPPNQLEQPGARGALRAAQEHFIRACLQQDDLEQCATEAETGLANCLDLIHQCLGAKGPARSTAATFSSRLTGFQVRGTDELASLERTSRWPGNAVFFQSSWREAEINPGQRNWQSWLAGLARARTARRRVVCGPLFRLERHDLPDWLYLWDDDFDPLQSYLCAYIRTAVEHLQRHVHVWYVASGTNADSELHLGEEQRLRLTLAALETLRQADPQTPTLVGIKQPWGEYLGRSSADLAPLQFADILIRSGLGISGLAMEISLACDVGKSLPRDLLELDRLLEQWSQLGLPLVIILSLATPAKMTNGAASVMTQLRDILALLESKSLVQGIIWGELRDQPNWTAGLLQSSGDPKAIWRITHDQWQAPQASAGS